MQPAAPLFERFNHHGFTSMIILVALPPLHLEELAWESHNLSIDGEPRHLFKYAAHQELDVINAMTSFFII
jgi:hypothetical protein